MFLYAPILPWTLHTRGTIAAFFVSAGLTGPSSAFLLITNHLSIRLCTPKQSRWWRCHHLRPVRVVRIESTLAA
jgi:hypothetical protein